MEKSEMLIQIIDHYTHGNKAQFAQLLGIKPQTVSTWMARSAFDSELIYSKCEGINADWLLSGDGDMIRGAGKTLDAIPLLPLSAMAGAFRGEQTVMDCDCEKYVVPAFRGADFLIHVKGDSMEPTYQSGDIVACRRVPMDGLFFQWNHVYVLDTDQGALIKRVKKSDEPGMLQIVSDNKLYDPFEIPVERIYNVALVMGTIRLE